MMASTTSNKAKTYALIYGGLEGDKIAHHFMHALEQRGLHQTTPGQADLIIAHSGGCFLIPTHHKAQVILAINPPYWPGRGIMYSVCQKLWQDVRLNLLKHPVTFLSKLVWNGVYLCIKPSYNLQLWKSAHDPKRLKLLPTAALVIRNRYDTFCMPGLAKHIPQHVIEMPGEHDDCWYHPEKYIKLIQEQYNGLLG